MHPCQDDLAGEPGAGVAGAQVHGRPLGDAHERHPIRRVLAIEPQSLTTRGRHTLAVMFERAMNLALLPDEKR